MNQDITTKSFDETEELGLNFAQELRSGDVVCLYGELGSGKTTFVKGIAKGLDIKARIISPTFVLIRSHRITNKQIRKKNIYTLYHLDLYRLDKKEVQEIGLKELLDDKNSVVVIEWSEKAMHLLSSKKWVVIFKILDENVRKILIKTPS